MKEIRWPIGEQSFSEIRKEGKIYIDKTMYIPLLLRNKYYFLSRPRRFGKSLFLSMLENFFLGKREFFRGLAVDSFTWDWEEFPIIHIDLSGGSYSTPEGLNSWLERSLLKIQRKYELQIEGNSPGEKFDDLIYKLYQKFSKKVVILIDEYEKPLLEAIGSSYFNHYRDSLHDFYAILKGNEEYIRFIFITGVTRFGHVSIFSGLNNLMDISLHNDYSAVCGLTEEEIKNYLSAGIETFALKNDISFDEAFWSLKQNYDGYHFSKQLVDVYNPFSLMDCLQKSEISNNWFESGSSSFLIDLIKEKRYDLSRIEGVWVAESRLKTIGPDLSDPVPLLYQSGYLTIKEYDKETMEYRLGYPNIEIEKGILEILIPLYLNSETVMSQLPATKLRKSLEEGQPGFVMEWLSGFFAGIPFDLQFRYENQFQAIILFIFNFICLPEQLKIEDHISRGSVDLTITTSKNVYLFEFKRDVSVKKALEQIEERRYYEKYRGSGKHLFCIGVKLDVVHHEIEAYEIVDKGVLS